MNGPGVQEAAPSRRPDPAVAARSRRVFVASLIGILLVQAAWMLAMPTFRGIDEFDHVYKAAAVSRGQWSSSGEARHGRGGLVAIPADIVAAASKQCASYRYTGHDNCFPAERLHDGRVVVATAASAYNPAYYWVAGTLSRPFHGDAVDYAMRVVTAMACALLLAWAVAIVAGWTSSSWPPVLLMLGLTPVLIYSGSIASPNGVAYSGAALMWAAMLATARSPQDGARFPLSLTIGACVLLCAHPTGPMFAFLGVVLALFLQPLRTWWDVATRNPVRWATAAVVVGLVAAASVAWIMYAHPAALGEPADSPLTMADYLRFQVWWALQAIAVFPTSTELAPVIVYSLWAVLLGGALIWLLRSTRTRERILLICALAVLVVVPTVFTAVTYADEGLSWQGRYSLPMWLGVTTLAAFVAARRGTTVRPSHLYLVVAAMAIGTTASILKVAHSETLHGVTKPVIAHVPGGLVVLGLLAVGGTVLPLVALRETPQRVV